MNFWAQHWVIAYCELLPVLCACPGLPWVLCVPILVSAKVYGKEIFPSIAGRLAPVAEGTFPGNRRHVW